MSVTLINIFEVPAGDEDAFIAAWEKTRDFLMTLPAHLETALHQSLHDERFRFVNIAGRLRTTSLRQYAVKGSGNRRRSCAGPCLRRSIRSFGRVRAAQHQRFSRARAWSLAHRVQTRIPGVR